MPLLIEAWQLAGEDESIKDDIMREYLTVSGEEFEKSLYRYIYALEEVTIEEEFSNIIPATDEEARASMELGISKDRIYGVVKNAKNAGN